MYPPVYSFDSVSLFFTERGMVVLTLDPEKLKLLTREVDFDCTHSFPTDGFLTLSISGSLEFRPSLLLIFFSYLLRSSSIVNSTETYMVHTWIGTN